MANKICCVNSSSFFYSNNIEFVACISFPFFYWHISSAFRWAVFFFHRPAFKKLFSFVSKSITFQPTEQKGVFSLLLQLAFLSPAPPQAPTPWPSSAAPCPPDQVLAQPAAAPSAYLRQALGSVEPLLRCFQPSWSEREPLLGHVALLPLEWARRGRQGPRWGWWWGQSSLCSGSSSLKLLAENIPHLVLWVGLRKSAYDAVR